MKRGTKELLLDFTPLLDVTMILLFFFVLFSRIGVDNIRQEAAQNMQDAKALHSEASQMMQDAEALQADADSQLAILAEADARAAEAAEAMIAFSRGENYRLRLKMEPDGWVLRIYQGKRIVGALEDSKTFTEDLKESLDRAGWKAADTLLCEFCYEAADPGSRAAYNRVDNALTEIRKQYPHLYISEIDLSQ